MSNQIFHRHHIIPRHMGGGDESENLITLSIHDHALAHKELYELHGKHEDYIAWKALSGQFNNSDILLEKCKLGGKIASQLNIGSKRTPEQKNKMSLARIGTIRSEQSKKKQSDSISGSKNHFFGKKHSEETIAKMSLLKKNKYVGNGNPRAKTIEYNGVVYTTLKECSNSTGISLYHLRKLI